MIRLVYREDLGEYDIALDEDGAIDDAGDIETAAVVALHCDRRVQPEEADGDDLRGWWADAFTGDRLGSKLWAVQERGILRDNDARRAQLAAEEALRDIGQSVSAEAMRQVMDLEVSAEVTTTRKPVLREAPSPVIVLPDEEPPPPPHLFEQLGVRAWYRGSSYDETTGQWTDLSGNGNHGSSAVASRPTSVVEAGHPAVAFDGTQWVDIPGILGANEPLTAWVVAKFDTPLSASGALLDLADAPGSAFRGHTLFLDVGGSTSLQYRVGPAPLSAATVWGFTDRGLAGYRMTHTQAARSIHINGVQGASQMEEKTTPAMTVGRIGAITRDLNNVPLRGRVLEVLIFGALGSEDVTAIDGQLTQTYA